MNLICAHLWSSKLHVGPKHISEKRILWKP